ncbi:hypothetical protein LINPERPRIM_LOCUS9943 [Linum perenne]
MCNILIANGKSGQILLPPPNGINSKLCPQTSVFNPMNRSGMNEFGLFHVVESLPIAHTLTIICAPLGTVNL